MSSLSISKTNFGWTRFRLLVVGLLGFWYLALFPGRLGYDYSLAIRMIQNGDSTTWWTGIYFWFLRLTSFGGQSIYLASLIGLISLAYSLWYFLKSAIKSREILERTYLLVLLFPLLGAFGVTVSHDVFQTSGILIFLGIGIRVYFDRIQNKYLQSHFLLGSLFLITTQTGIYTVLIATLVSVFTRIKWKLIPSLLVVVIFSFLGNIGISESIIKHPISNILIADLRCVTQHPEAEISPKEWSVLNEIAEKELWKKPLSCSNPDALITSLGAEKKDLSLNINFVTTYLSISAKNSAIIVQAHLQRSLGALPPPFFQGPENQVDRNIKNPVGLGTNTALQLGPEILHPSIDEPSVATKIGFLKPLEVIAQAGIFLINQASWFWGWGGLWLYPLVYFYLFKIGIRKVVHLGLVLLPTLLLHISYVVVGPGPLGRYYFSTILAGFSLSVSILVGAFIDRKLRENV